MIENIHDLIPFIIQFFILGMIITLLKRFSPYDDDSYDAQEDTSSIDLIRTTAFVQKDDLEEWSCEYCDQVNDVDARNCERCSAPKPKKKG